MPQHFFDHKSEQMKKQLSIFLQALVLAAAPVLLPAQNSSMSTNDIQGFIKDWTSGETLPYANIILLGEDRGTSSNADGYFVMINAPAELCSLYITYIGYESKIFVFDNISESKKAVTIELKPKTLEGQAVTVTADSYEIWESTPEISHMAISPRQLQTLPNLGEIDIFRSIKLLPGISSVGDGKSGLFVRGGTPDQNLVILDGMTVYHVDHFFGMFSAFNVNAIKDVQIYTGGFPAKYGGRLSSVVDLTGKRGGDYQQLSFGANLLSANLSYETPLWDGAGSWLISARRSYTDIFQSPTYNAMYEFVTGDEAATGSNPAGPGGGLRDGAFQQEVIPKFYYYDLNSKLSFNPTNKDFLSLSFYNGKDFLDKSRELGTDGGGGFRTSGGTSFDTRIDENLTEWGNIGASVRWGHQWNSRVFSNLLLANSVFESNFERNLSISGANVVGINDSTGAARGLGSFAQNEYNTVNDLTLRFDNQWQISNSHKMEFGLFGSRVGTDYLATVRDSLNILDIESNSTALALYTQDQWQVNLHTSITFGLRSTFFDQTNTFYNAPRLSATYNLTDKLKLKGAWGHYYQFTNTIENENILQGSKVFWLSANKHIEPGFSVHSILGLSYEPSNYFFSVEGYYKTLDNLVEFTPRFQDRADYLNYFFFGSGVSQGVELLAQKKRGALTGWAAYTLANVEHQFPNLNGGNPFPASHDRTHELKLVGNYKLGPWNISSSWVYSTGAAYTAPENQYFLEMLDGQQLSYIHVGDKNAYRFPSYQRLDLSISRKWENSRYEFDAGLSFYNMLNHANISYRDYDLDVTPIIASDVLMLGFTPTIFFRANLK